MKPFSKFIKKNKKIVVGILLFATAFVGVYFVKNQDKEKLGSNSKDNYEILLFLESLEKETRTNFSEITETEVHWIVDIEPEMNEVDIKGYGYEAKGTLSKQHESIEPFLLNQGFEVDMYNIADGTIVGLVGYKKGQLVCTVTAGAGGYKEVTGQWTSPNLDEMDVGVKCGKLE